MKGRLECPLHILEPARLRNSRQPGLGRRQRVREAGSSSPRARLERSVLRFCACRGGSERVLPLLRVWAGLVSRDWDGRVLSPPGLVRGTQGAPRLAGPAPAPRGPVMLRMPAALCVACGREAPARSRPLVAFWSSEAVGLRTRLWPQLGAGFPRWRDRRGLRFVWFQHGRGEGLSWRRCCHQSAASVAFLEKMVSPVCLLIIFKCRH